MAALEFVIPIDVYACKILVVVTDDREKTYKKHNIKPTNGLASCYIKPVGSKYLCLLRFDKNSISPNLITHECVHAAIHILDCVGVKLDPDNDEPLAYLVTYLFSKTMDKTFSDVTCKV